MSSQEKRTPPTAPDGRILQMCQQLQSKEFGIAYVPDTYISRWKTYSSSGSSHHLMILASFGLTTSSSQGSLETQCPPRESTCTIGARDEKGYILTIMIISVLCSPGVKSSKNLIYEVNDLLFLNLGVFTHPHPTWGWRAERKPLHSRAPSCLQPLPCGDRIRLRQVWAGASQADSAEVHLRKRQVSGHVASSCRAGWAVNCEVIELAVENVVRLWFKKFKIIIVYLLCWG